MALRSLVFNDAFRDMQRAFSLLEEPLHRTMTAASRFSYPPTNIKETDASYELQAELPGFNKEDIQIEQTDSRSLLLKGKQKHENIQTVADGQETSKDAPWWTNERVVGAFSRSFSFPANIKGEGIKATYKDGVLSINVPKADITVKRIPIE
ncbi:HSP20-like chaperone [Syncephalastrum racemosum]|uniref:HSP20-like chaperone n=1 Tax=Syncephalastrum racemosum TaxID=13706 RepID=A0A1X2HVK0_SYNRA|nr:HSP20-like chaperone [Syncephalastrum racemosum]